jgi:ribosomal protein S18 acetylase RimI-like enzyme
VPVVRIHPIGPDDWPAWRSVRLRALLEAPDAFGSSYQRAAAPDDPEQYWRGYFTPYGQNYLAEIDGETVGLVRVVARPDGADGELMSLWVAPHVRGLGVGAELVETCWQWLQATAPGRPLRLSVRRHNVAARRLYERLGFRFTGPDPDDLSEDVLIRRPDHRAADSFTP